MVAEAEAVELAPGKWAWSPSHFLSMIERYYISGQQSSHYC